MHDYKGWLFGVIALEQEGRWSARIEVYEPGRPSREQSPMPLLALQPARRFGHWRIVSRSS